MITNILFVVGLNNNIYACNEYLIKWYIIGRKVKLLIDTVRVFIFNGLKIL